MKNDRCKNCAYHWNAGHKPSSPHYKSHNDWCMHFGKTAKRAIGECRLKNARKEREFYK